MSAHALLMAALLAPHVAEFGGTFGGDVGGVALGRDGTVWVNEHDRIAHVERNARVREYRLPIDLYQGRPGPSGRIGIGPGGDMWFDATSAVGRISPSGRIHIYPVARAGEWGYVNAFAVSPQGVWFALAGGLGVTRLDARGARSRSETDLTGGGAFGRTAVTALAAAPDGALWMATRGGSDFAIYRRPAGGARQRVPGAGDSTTALLGTTPSGALVAARFEWQPRRAHVERIEPDGRVTTLSDFEPAGYAAQAGAIAFARDGTMWLTEPGRGRLVRFAPDGSQRDVRRGLPDTAAPFGVAADDAGGAWFSDVSNDTVGYVAADGAVRTIGHGPIPESTPAYPVVASDGAVWFREAFDWRRRLARLAPDGTLREFPNVGSGPLLARGSDALTATGHGVVAVSPGGAVRAIAPQVAPPPERFANDYDVTRPAATAAATAPDGAAWFAVGPALARIDRNGAVRTIPVRELRPDSIAFDTKGTLWFTDTDRSLVGSVTRDGRVRTHTRGLTRWDSGPQWIARGPDGAMWFTEVRDRIGRITRDGRITEFARGIPHRASLGGIMTGPDGALWFTAWHGNVLGRITADGRVTLHRGLVTPSRGNEHDPDAVFAPDGRGGAWFNESQGGRLAHLTFR